MWVVEAADPALHRAVSGGDVEKVESLLSRGVNVNKTNARGLTALHLAANGDEWRIAAALLRYGADLEAVDDENKRPLHYAVEESSVNMVEWLLRQGARWDVPDADGDTALDSAKRIGQKSVLALFDYYHLLD